MGALPMGWVVVVALWAAARHPEPTVLADGVLPGRGGNPWGPKATLARARGELPAVLLKPEAEAWDRWGRHVLRDGDVVFRLGDTRIVWGFFPLSRFIARASGSHFSHVGVVAVEHDGPVVYDCAAVGIQRQPFAVWIEDRVGAFGVKRLKPEHRGQIAGVLDFCRRAFETQVPFDFEFSLDDEKLYCVELVEKAFRSQGLPLSKPVCIGDWRNIRQFPLSSLAIVGGSRFLLHIPISLEQPVYLPGDDHQGIWSSRWLDTVVFTKPVSAPDMASPMPDGFGIRGDVAIVQFVAGELRSLGWTLRTARLVVWPIVASGRRDIRKFVPSRLNRSRNQIGDRPISARTDRSSRFPLADPDEREPRITCRSRYEGSDGRARQQCESIG